MRSPRIFVQVSSALSHWSGPLGWSTYTSRTSSIWTTGLGEMRLRGRDGIARALYITAAGQRVVVLRVFAKKTQKTPRREIELAHRRAREVT
jgi:phage-related protein